MKRQILNLEGVAVLTKQQQKRIDGGIQTISMSSDCNCNTDADCSVNTERCTNSCGGFNDTTPKSYYGKCSGGYPPKPNPGFGLIG